MDSRQEYLFRMMEQIGGPLLASISEVSARDPASAAAHNHEELAQKDAQRIAELLSRSVQASIDMTNLIDLNPQDPQIESVRVAMAALGARLVARQYTQHGRVPAEAELKKSVSSLQSVLTFSDNFVPSPEAIARLHEMEQGIGLFDGHQLTIRYLDSFLPVVEAVGAFSFGQPEKKLVLDICQRLSQRAGELRAQIFEGRLDEDQKKLCELSFLDALCNIYASCHMAELSKMTASGSALPDETSAGAGLERIWQAFELRYAMICALAEKMIPTKMAGQGSASSSKAPALSGAQSAPPPVMPPPVEAPVAPPEQSAPPPPSATAPAAPPAIFGQQRPVESAPPQAAQQTPPAGANPMSMFAKKPESEAPAAPVAPPPVAAPPMQQQTAPPPAAANPMSMFAKKPEGEGESVPPQQAPAQAPPPPAEQAPPPTSPPSQAAPPEAQQGGGPMSFFKKKPEGEDSA